MKRYIQTVEAVQFHLTPGDHAGQEGPVCWGCTSQHRPHVHGLDTLQFGFGVGYEKSLRFLEDGDWIVYEGDDPDGPGPSPRIVSNADFKKRYKAATT